MTPDWVSRCGRVRLYCADCLDVLPTLDAASVHAVVIDPPYSSGTRREGAKGLRKSMNRTTDADDWFGFDCMTTNGFVWLMRAVAVQSKRTMARGAHFFSFIDWRMSASLSSAIESADMRFLGVLVWDKVAFGMGTYFRNQHEFILHFSNGRTRLVFRHDVPNILRASRMIADAEHDTQKPVELLKEIISTVTAKNETVADWFMGTGSTGVAAVRLGRRFIGVEIDPTYFAAAVRRIDAELHSMPLLDAMEDAAALTQTELFAPDPTL